MHKKTAFYLITDSHYVSAQTWEDGMAFTRRERGDQIALKATPQILDAFVEKILADTQTDTVLFTGDNVNSGDMQSHEEFRQRLERLTAGGKKVYVLTATHDYNGAGEDENTFRAVHYKADSVEPIPFMRKGELFDYYADYGPRQALAVHRSSGSYAVKLGDGVQLIAIGDNGNGHTYCGLDDDGFNWLDTQIRLAKEAGDCVLLAVHHPVLPPWEVFRHAADYELFGGYETLQKMMCDNGVRVVFTGHTHVQNIRKYTDAEGRWFLDVSTIALANAAGKMRHVTVDADSGMCNVTSVGVESLPGVDTHGESVYAYLHALNFPGILEKLLPLGAHDFPAFLSLADGFLPIDKLQAHAHLIAFACRKAEKAKLSLAAHLGGTWRALSPAQRRETKEKRLADVVFEVLRHIYPGDAPFTPDTTEYLVLHGAACRLDRLLSRFPVEAVQKWIPPGSCLAQMAEDFLYNNRTGSDDTICFSLTEG